MKRHFFLTVAVVWVLGCTYLLASGVTLVFSHGPNGPSPGTATDSPCVSPDGRWAVFEGIRSVGIGWREGVVLNELWKYNFDDNLWAPLNPTTPDGATHNPSFDPTLGRWVFCESDATNLTGTPAPPGMVYAFDVVTQTWTQVSRTLDGSSANSACSNIRGSANGIVTYLSRATNLAPGSDGYSDQVFATSMRTWQSELISRNVAGEAANASCYDVAISADGRFVVFATHATNLLPGVNNGHAHVYRRDRSVAPGTPGWLVQVDVTNTGTSANGYSSDTATDATGRFVAFASEATNMPGGSSSTQVYLRDMQTGRMRLISVNFSGQPGNSASGAPAITPDGRYIAFGSSAADLVPGDSNLRGDVFVRDWLAGKTYLISGVNGGSTPANHASLGPSISASGRRVVFTSYASDLAPGDTDYQADVFAHTRKGADETLVRRHSPGQMADDVCPWTTVELQFTHPIIAGSFHPHLYAGEVEQTVTTTVAPDGASATIAPTAPLPNNTLCTLAIPAGTRYKGGGKTDFAERSHFRIGNRPAVRRWVPSGNTVAVDSVISCTFTHTMRQGSVEARFSIVPFTIGTFAWDGRKMTFTPVADLMPGTTYTVRIGGGATATTGQGMRRPFEWTFTTAGAVGAPLTLSAFAVPTAGGAQISITLSQAAAVQVRVLNLAGREVAALTERELPSGASSLLWDGRSRATGTRVPSGRYLLELVARTPDGAQMRTMAPLAR